MLDALILLLDALILLVRFVIKLMQSPVLPTGILHSDHCSCILTLRASLPWDDPKEYKHHQNPNKKWFQTTHQESVIPRLDDEILRQTAYILHNPSLGYSLETFETWKWMPEWMSTRTMIWSSGQGWLWLTLWLPGRRHCGRIGYLQHMQP